MRFAAGGLIAFGSSAAFCVGLGFEVADGVVDGTVVGTLVEAVGVAEAVGADWGALFDTQERSPKIDAAAINVSTTRTDSFLYSTPEA